MSILNWMWRTPNMEMEWIFHENVFFHLSNAMVDLENYPVYFPFWCGFILGKNKIARQSSEKNRDIAIVLTDPLQMVMLMEALKNFSSFFSYTFVMLQKRCTHAREADWEKYDVHLNFRNLYEYLTVFHLDSKNPAKLTIHWCSVKVMANLICAPIAFIPKCQS